MFLLPPLALLDIHLALGLLARGPLHDAPDQLEARVVTVHGQLQWLKVEPYTPRQPVWVPSPKTRVIGG
jgi:hypothetical protein